MHKDQPRRQPVDELMQQIRIRHTVDRSHDRQAEEQHIRDQLRSTGQARDHMARTHGLNEQDVGHDAADVVVRGEGRKPVHGEVVDPDHEYGDVDR